MQAGRNLVISLVVAAGYLAFTWPRPAASPTPVRAPVFTPGERGEGPTAADRKAAEYWRKHPRPRTRSTAVASSWTYLTGNNATGATQLILTVPAGGVAIGSRVVAATVMLTSAGTLSAVDSRGNTYAVDASANNASAARVIVISAPVTTALLQNDTITLSYTESTDIGAAVYVVAGLTDGGVLDQTNSATGSSTSPSAGSVTTTANDGALLTIIGISVDPNPVFTEGAGWTGGNDAEIPVATVGFIQHRAAEATGTYTGNGTFDSSSQWSAAVVSYKAAGASTQTLTPDAVTYTYVVPAPTATHVVTLSPDAVTHSYVVPSATVTVRPRMIALRRWWRSG